MSKSAVNPGWLPVSWSREGPAVELSGWAGQNPLENVAHHPSSPRKQQLWGLAAVQYGYGPLLDLAHEHPHPIPLLSPALLAPTFIMIKVSGENHFVFSFKCLAFSAFHALL